MSARFLITNLTGPAAYFLYGAGDFRPISRNLQRELFAALALGLIFGPTFGLKGVAWSFLVATAFGTLFSIIRVYTKKTGESFAGVMKEIWWRAVAGFCVSWLCSKLALAYLPRGAQLVFVGGFGLAAGLMGCVVWSLLRMPRKGMETNPESGLLKLMKGI